MRSDMCPWRKPGLCPDAEIVADVNHDAIPDVFVVLPYCARPEHYSLAAAVAETAGGNAARIRVSRTVACRTGDSVSLELHSHCSSTRLQAAILGSGARAVLAIGRGAAEARYPVPSVSMPAPEDVQDPASALAAGLEAFRLAVRGPEVVYRPAGWPPAPGLRLAMHPANHGDIAVCAERGVVWQVSVLEAAACEPPLIYTLDAPRLLRACPELVAVPVADVSARAGIPAPQREPLPGPAPWQEWLDAVRGVLPEAAELLEQEPDHDVLEQMRTLNEWKDIEAVLGPPPAWADHAAARMAETAWILGQEVA